MADHPNLKGRDRTCLIIGLGALERSVEWFEVHLVPSVPSSE